MSTESNGISNYELLQEIHTQSENLTALEAILEQGFRNVTEELKSLRGSLAEGLLKTINILCYCLVAIIMWVTAIKTLPQILGITDE